MAVRDFKSTSTEWRDVVLVCRKCSKKLDGGFGPDGDLTLKKALRKYFNLKKGKKGRKGDLVVTGVVCFDVCPRGGVIAVNGARPKQLLIVPAGADLLEVKARLGLQDHRRARAPLGLVENG